MASQPDAGAVAGGQPGDRLAAPGRWRKKPIEITAIQFTGSNVEEIWATFGAAGIYGPTEKNPDHLILTTVHGDPAPCRAGDWVVPDAKPDTFYPVKPEVFAATYEPATASPPAEADPMWMHAYRDVQAVLDEALGTEEEDGAGAGIAADVALLAAQRDAARAEARQVAARLKELTEPGLFAVVPAAADPETSRSDEQHAIGSVIRHAESWAEQGGQLDASEVARVLLLVLRQWTGGLQIPEGAPASSGVTITAAADQALAEAVAATAYEIAREIDGDARMTEGQNWWEWVTTIVLLAIGDHARIVPKEPEAPVDLGFMSLPAEIHQAAAEAHASPAEQPAEDGPWVHGTRLGREHRSVRTHLAEDHSIDPDWAASASDGSVHGKHDGLHGKTWAYSLDLPHGFGTMAAKGSSEEGAGRG